MPRTKKQPEMRFWLNTKTGVRMQTPKGSAMDAKADADPGTFHEVRALVDKRTVKSEDEA